MSLYQEEDLLAPMLTKINVLKGLSLPWEVTWLHTGFAVLVHLVSLI